MNQWLQELKKDKNFRVLWISFINMGWNLIYSLYNGILAIVYHSYWFFTMFVYYLALSRMRAHPSLRQIEKVSYQPTGSAGLA